MKSTEFAKTVEALTAKVGPIQDLLKELRKSLAQRQTSYSDGELGIPGSNLLMEKSDDPKIRKLQETSDKIYLLSKILGVDPRSTKLYHQVMGSELGKAMDTATASEGLEWVPTAFTADLIDKVRLSLRVAALFTTIPQPTNPYKVPVVASDATGFLIPEETADSGTAIAASTPGTSNVTLSAQKLAARVLFSEELTEDSIVPVLPFVRNNVARALGDAMESAILSGDLTATHQDSDVTASTDARKAYEGLRFLALTGITGVSTDLSTFNIANIRAIRRSIGIFGVDPNDLAWICGAKIYNRLLALTEVTTVDQFGPGATILQGELAKLDGIPIIVSGKAREDLNASGVFDGTTTNKGTLILVHRPSFLIGDRRQVTTKTKEEIEFDQTMLVSTMRQSFKRVFATTEPMVAIGFNAPT